MYRLMYPYMLNDSEKDLYMEYLENNKSEIVNLFIENKSIDEVEFMLELFGSDREMIETAIVKAAETGFGEVTALVLKYRRKKEDIRKERYSF